MDITQGVVGLPFRVVPISNYVGIAASNDQAIYGGFCEGKEEQDRETRRARYIVAAANNLPDVLEHLVQSRHLLRGVIDNPGNAWPATIKDDFEKIMRSQIATIEKVYRDLGLEAQA